MGWCIVKVFFLINLIFDFVLLILVLLKLFKVFLYDDDVIIG